MGAVMDRGSLESHHEMNMDMGKRLQLEGDVQEMEKMTESGEDDWDNDWDSFRCTR